MFYRREVGWYIVCHFCESIDHSRVICIIFINILGKVRDTIASIKGYMVAQQGYIDLPGA